MSDTESDPQTDPEAEGGSAPETDVQESDPNADSAHGLSGGMGVSSERVGDLRGTGGAGGGCAGEGGAGGGPECGPAGDETRHARHHT